MSDELEIKLKPRKVPLGFSMPDNPVTVNQIQLANDTDTVLAK